MDPRLGDAQPAGPSADRFGPHHVPELLWEREFSSRFASFFPPGRPKVARSFCSIALVKLSWPLTWDEATAAIGLDPETLRPSTWFPGYLQRKRAASSIDSQLEELARSIAMGPRSVNYAKRHAAFAHLTDIDEVSWARLRRQFPDSIRNSPYLRSNCAAWIWVMLTGGNEALSPASVSHPELHMTSMRAKFRKYRLILVADALYTYAEGLLQCHLDE